METTAGAGQRRTWVEPVTQSVVPRRSSISHDGGTAAQNDMTISGTYRGVSDRADYSVQIDAEGAPDTFTWSERDASGNVLSSGSTVAITGAAQHLSQGVFVTFAGTDNHTLDERWAFVWDSHDCADEQTTDGFARRITGHLRHTGAISDADGRILLNDLYSNAPGYRFDGVNDLLNTPDDADLDVGVDDFSIQVVFRPDSVATALQWLVNKEAGGIGWGLQLREDDLWLRIDDNTTDDTGYVALNAAVAGQVCNVVVTVDRSGHATAYVNGVAVAQDAYLVDTAALTLASAGALRIGSSTAGADFFKGDIYTVRVWNRLLSASEARGLSKGAAVLYADLMAAASASSTEHLQDPGAFGGTWAHTGNLSAAGGGLRWLYAANGTHTSTQTAANRLVTGTAGKRYRLVYTVVSITTPPDGTVAATLTTAFASAAVTLDVASTGRKIFDFVAAEGAATGDFVFQVVSTSCTVGQFLLDNFSLIEIGAVAEYDGDGVDSATWFDGSGNANNGTVTSATMVNALTHLTIAGSVHLTGDLTVDGNLTVSGTQTILNVDTITTEEPLMSLATGNAADILDLGLYARYNDGTARWTGLFRDATDGWFKLFDTLDAEPTTTVATADPQYDHADLQVGALTADDNVILGTSGSNTVAVNGQVNTNLAFVAEVARLISVVASAADVVGANLTITAATGGAAAAAAGGAGGTLAVAGGAGGAGAAAQLAGAGGAMTVAGGDAGADGGGGGANGGDLNLRAGNASAAGVDGVVRIGATNTSAVIVTPGTTFSALADFDLGATLAAGQAITGDGEITLGVVAGAFDIRTRMGDAAGAQKFRFDDSGGVEVGSVNSDGLGTFTGISIGSAGARVVKDLGRLSSGWIRWALNSNAADTVTIAGEVYTAVDGAPGAGQFQRDGGGGIPDTVTSFVAVVNAGTVARAIDVGGDCVALMARLTTQTDAVMTLAESSAGVRTVVSGATLLGRSVPAERTQISGSYSVIAADVTSWAAAAANEVSIAGFPSTTEPTLLSVVVRSAAGVCKNLATVGARFVQSGANEWALVILDPVAVLAATDVITFLGMAAV